MKIGYFPGCSLHATAREYAESLKAIAKRLDVELTEIEDWACCGATSAHATNHLLGVALPARTLALASEQDMEEILAPCAACYSRLATARHELKEDQSLKETVDGMLDRTVDTNVRVRSLVKFLQEQAPSIKGEVRRPLEGLKVACYYGCLLVRPPELTDMDDSEAPTSMEAVVEAAGAKAVEWNRRIDCCGGGFSLSRTSSVVRLSRSIIEDARLGGADLIAVACPMCHSNLDFRQKAIAKRTSSGADMPILFLSQLVGLALGEDPAALGLDRHFVDTNTISTRLSGDDVSEHSETKEVG